MDLLSLASTADAVLELKDPNSDPPAVLRDEQGAPVAIAFWGLDTAEFRRAARAQAERARKRIKSGEEITHEQDVEDGVRWLASVTKGWSASIALGGAPLPFSPENAMRLYREVYWVGEQAADFVRRIGLRQTFSKASAAS